MSRTKYKELTLLEFIATRQSQADAAMALGCNQSNIPQALKDIERGIKKVTVRVYPDGTIEADIIKPFGSRRKETQSAS